MINFPIFNTVKIAHIYENNLLVSAHGEDPVTLEEMARCFADRLIALFLKNEEGNRPIWGENFPFKSDPAWEDYIHFYEYFNPETGKGLGAAHQTGWSALVANLIDEFRR